MHGHYFWGEASFGGRKKFHQINGGFPGKYIFDYFLLYLFSKGRFYSPEGDIFEKHFF